MLQPLYQDAWVTLYCADARAVLAQLAPRSVDLILTDPPYNVSSESHADNLPYKTKGGRVSRKLRHFGDWDRNWRPRDLLRPASFLLRPGGSLVAFTSDYLMSAYKYTRGWQQRGAMVWAKNNPPVRMRATGYRPGLEYLVWLATEGGPVTWHGGGRTINVFRYPLCAGRERYQREDGTAVHPTQKPLALVRELVGLHSNPGDLLLDPYCGTGTMLAAAKAMGRRCIGVEANEEYAQIAADRLRRVVPCEQHALLLEVPEAAA